MNVVHSTLVVLLLTLFAVETVAQGPPRAVFEPAPIAKASPDSPVFTFVNSSECDPKTVATIYKLYERNAMVFQTCATDSKYQLFPFDGTYPTSEQIGYMARSLACRALFSSALLAGIPECNMGGSPLRAASETLLKIIVDVRNYPMSPAVIPSTPRFVDLVYWRRDVNLAEAAGLPSGSKSELYSEYASNLYTVATDGLVRLTTDLKVEYRPDVDTAFSQEMIMAVPELPILRGSGSISGSVGSASAATSNDTIVVENPDTVPGIPPAEARASSAGSSSWKKPQSVFLAAVMIFVLA
ncbi:hypothetical protein L917_05443 [Phytophthora nicotianae]|uniref:Elicitin n=1 Tax=Phytophthora nicotianae TaxID=4792 RepID=W2LIE7_PHYNI|nr:hypothetical protein L917_05443 [Phytophthora nicotianae]